MSADKDGVGAESAVLAPLAEWRGVLVRSKVPECCGDGLWRYEVHAWDPDHPDTPMSGMRGELLTVVQNKVGTFCPQENGFNALLKGTDDKPVDGTPPRAGLGWRYMDPGCVGRMCPSDIVWTVYWVDKPIGSVKIKAGLCAERGYHVFSADGKQLFTIKEERPGCCNLMYIPYKIEMGDTDVEVGFARRYIRQFGFRQTRPPFGIKFPDSATKEQKALLALAFVQIDRDLAAREIKSEVDDSPAPSG